MKKSGEGAKLSAKAASHYNGGLWDVIRMNLRVGGDPDRQLLIMALRGTEPVPAEVREWLASQFESRKFRGHHGAPLRKSAYERLVDDLHIIAVYDDHLERIETEREAERHEEKLGKKKRRMGPKLVPPVQLALQRTQETLATATVVSGKRLPGDHVAIETIRAVIKRRPK
jgi:hypothetical protein